MFEKKVKLSFDLENICPKQIRDRADWNRVMRGSPVYQFNYLHFYFEINHNQLILHCLGSAGILIRIPKSFDGLAASPIRILIKILEEIQSYLLYLPHSNQNFIGILKLAAFPSKFWFKFLKNFKVI